MKPVLFPRECPYNGMAYFQQDYFPIPIGSMYGIYANIGGILMGFMLPYIAYMDPMGYNIPYFRLVREIIPKWPSYSG